VPWRGVAVLQLDGIVWTAVTISEDGQKLHDLPDGVSFACISADGSTFAVADRFEANVFDFTSGAKKASVRHGDRPSATGVDLTQIALSRDGTRLLTASNDATARVWDTATGKELLRFDHVDEALITDAFFAAEERAVVTVGTDCSARAWSAVSGRSLVRIANRHNPKVVGWSNLGFEGAWLSRDGAIFSAAITGGLVQAWRQRMLCERQLQPDPRDAETPYPRAWKVQTSSDGAAVAIFRSDDTVHIADVAGGDVLSIVKIKSGLSEAMMIEPWQAIVTCDARSSRCVARATSHELWEIKHQAMVQTLAYDALRNVLAIAGGEYGGATPGFVDVVDATGSLRAKAEMSGWVSALCFHPKRQTMLIGDVNGELAEWSSSARDLSALGSFPGRIDAIAAPPEGAHYYVAAEGALWRVHEDGATRHKIAPLTSTARSIQCSPSGEVLFAGTVTGPRFFDVNRGALILDLKLGVGAPGEEEFEDCSVTPDWRRLIGVTNRRRRVDFDLSGLGEWTGEPPAMLLRALGNGNHLARISERKDLLMAEQPHDLVAWLSAQAHLAR
jgi:WD40 repeat protein